MKRGTGMQALIREVLGTLPDVRIDEPGQRLRLRLLAGQTPVPGCHGDGRLE